MRSTQTTDAVQIDSWLTEEDERSLANDVLDGLTQPFKELAAQALLRHARLGAVRADPRLPEYYPTRAELAILRARADEIVAAHRRPASWSSSARARRTRRACCSTRCATPGTLRRYIPLDVSAVVVSDAARGAHRRVSGPQRPRGHRGSRAPPRARAGAGGAAAGRASRAARSATSRPGPAGGCCAGSPALLGPEDRLLLGTDLVKDPAVLEAAYNDSAGVTARVQPQPPARAQPRARGRLHCPRRSTIAPSTTAGASGSRCACARSGRCRSTIADLELRVEFAAGEELRTEISCKFTRDRVAGDLDAAGLALERWLTDPEGLLRGHVARLSG